MAELMEVSGGHEMAEWGSLRPPDSEKPVAMASWAATITERLNEVSNRFERGVSRFTRIDLRLDGVDETMLQMSAKLTTMNVQLSTMTTQLTHIDECADKTQASVERWMKHNARHQRHNWSPMLRIVYANKWPVLAVTLLFCSLALKFIGGMPIHIQAAFAIQFIDSIKGFWGSI